MYNPTTKPNTEEPKISHSPPDQAPKSEYLTHHQTESEKKNPGPDESHSRTKHVPGCNRVSTNIKTRTDLTVTGHNSRAKETTQLRPTNHQNRCRPRNSKTNPASMVEPLRNKPRTTSRDPRAPPLYATVSFLAAAIYFIQQMILSLLYSIQLLGFWWRESTSFNG